MITHSILPFPILVHGSRLNLRNTLRRALPVSHVADDDAQDPAVDEKKGQRRQPQARRKGAAAEELELEPLLQPRALSRDPEGKHGEPAQRPAQQGRAREVQRQEDHVPEEVLARADLVEGDEGEGLGQHGGGEVLLGHDKGDQEGGEEELREEGEGLGAREGGGCGGGGCGGGGGLVELDVVGAEVVAVVDAGDVVEVGVLQEGEAISFFSRLVSIANMGSEIGGATYIEYMSTLSPRNVARLTAPSCILAGLQNRLAAASSPSPLPDTAFGARPPIRSPSIDRKSVV